MQWFVFKKVGLDSSFLDPPQARVHSLNPAALFPSPVPHGSSGEYSGQVPLSHASMPLHLLFHLPGMSFQGVPCLASSFLLREEVEASHLVGLPKSQDLVGGLIFGVSYTVKFMCLPVILIPGSQRAQIPSCSSLYPSSPHRAGRGMSFPSM